MPVSSTTPPTPLWRRIARFLAHASFVVLAVLGSAWAATAMYFQLAGVVQIVAWAVLAAACIWVLTLRFRHKGRGWLVLALGAGVVALWYQTLQPRQDRDWADEVAQGVSGRVEGSIATLDHVRNFNWTTEVQAVPRWETRSYELDRLATVDMFTSTWGDPNIAHLLVSFGFDGATGQPARYVTFSVEIRKERGEAFSSVGGFFRQFELVLIAADEADIVKVRTNLRGEDVRMFPIKLNAEQRRTLFLSYLDLGNQLARAPVFYNTITGNCTTVVYRLVQVIKPDMPLDRRLVLSGQLPEYIGELGGLPGDMPMDERRAEAEIGPRAKAALPDQDFSTAIRQP